MYKAIISTLLLFLLVAATQAAISSEELIDPPVKIPPPMPRPILSPRNAVEHFTLGNKVSGALPVYTYQNAVTYDSPQSEITVLIDYPTKNDGDDDNVDDDDDSTIITQVDVYLEGNEDFQTQAYIIEGGIGQRSISIEIVANDTDLLRYTVIVYAQKV